MSLPRRRSYCPKIPRIRTSAARFQPSADRQEAERRRGGSEGEDQYPAKRPLRDGKPPLWYRFFSVTLDRKATTLYTRVFHAIG